MAAKAFAFLTAYLRRRQHCRARGHKPHTRKFRGRVVRLECWTCGETFWQREGQH